MRYSIILLAIIIAGCAQASKPHNQISNYETAGNLQSNASSNCVSFASVTNEHTPADIYPGIVECVRFGKYNNAVQLFALAGVYGRFDMLRVTDPTARQAIQVLQLDSFSFFTAEQQKAFKESMDAYASTDSREFSDLCAQISLKGAPSYHPSYMIRHGLGAFAEDSGKGTKSDFDPVKGWAEAMSSYLHCS